MPVMALADKYNVLDLMSLCKNFMIENIPSASRCNQLMNWLQYSFACGHQQLANACRYKIVNPYYKINVNSM
jgi:hypothetical protein